MKIQLLRKLIINDMNPQLHTLSFLEMEHWTELLPALKGELIDHMEWVINLSFTGYPPRKRIGALQAECGTLLNALGKVDNPIKGVDDLKLKTGNTIMEILDKIEYDYANYSAAELSLPELRLTKALVEIEQQKNKIAADFKKLAIDPQLQKVILKVMEDISKAKRCSYERMSYLRNFQEAIIELLAEKNTHLESHLLNLLYSMNFNYAGFIDYYQERIKAQVAAITCEKSRGYQLQHYLQQFKRAPFRKKKIQFDANKKTTAMLMYEFTNAEIFFLERKIQANKKTKPAESPQPAPVQYQSADTAPAPPSVPTANYKILSLNSVDLLAYFFRLMIEAGVIEAGVKTELTRFLASILTTPRTGSNGISGDSFYRKYREPVHSTAVQTKASLIKMIKLIDAAF